MPQVIILCQRALIGLLAIHGTRPVYVPPTLRAPIESALSTEQTTRLANANATRVKHCQLGESELVYVS